MTTTKHYGSWASPISSDLIASANTAFQSVAYDQGRVYLQESRPSEAGRSLLRVYDLGWRDLTPTGFNVRSRVHEYGGGAFLVHGDSLYFSNFQDQGVYCQATNGGTPRLLASGYRFADYQMDQRRSRLLAVCEDHSGRRVENSVCAIDLSTGRVSTLLSGADFYSSPRLSPDGQRLAYLCWNHPDMPWDRAQLRVCVLTDTGVAEDLLVVGDEAVAQPRWSADGWLYYVSDPTGWWNLHRWRAGHTECLLQMEAEFAESLWVFGMSNYDLLGHDKIACACTSKGLWKLLLLDLKTRDFQQLNLPYTRYSSVCAGGGKVYFLGASGDSPTTLVEYDPATSTTRELASSASLPVDRSYLSLPEPVEFPTRDGLTAHAFYYRPVNPDFRAPQGELPPLIVISHGGPTASAQPILDMRLQYWTSRGFGVLDVNYSGSTGYGRAYRQRLYGQWGVADVEDCVRAAEYMVAKGLADPDRLIIRGSSAGGYTTLCALTFHTTFRAGASYYGICDLEALERDTHKFESRYNHRLIAPYPERADVYRARSPIHSVDMLSCPLIIFQGLEDRVVPPEQARKMYEALCRKGVATACVLFEGEQHGLRRAESIKRALEAELYFYSRVFGFELAEHIAPLEIANL